MCYKLTNRFAYCHLIILFVLAIYLLIVFYFIDLSAFFIGIYIFHITKCSFFFLLLLLSQKYTQLFNYLYLNTMLENAINIFK